MTDKGTAFTTEEVEVVKSLYNRVPTAEIARKLGRSRNGVINVIDRLKAANDLPTKVPTKAPTKAHPDDTLSELYFTRDILRRELMAAEGVTVARLAAEYRNTIIEIEKREANDGADNDPLTELADALISRASKA